MLFNFMYVQQISTKSQHSNDELKSLKIKSVCWSFCSEHSMLFGNHVFSLRFNPSIQPGLAWMTDKADSSVVLAGNIIHPQTAKIQHAI